jgi:hypothetical protein
MPLEKIKAQAQLLKKIAEALKEARAAGVRDPVGLLKKALESKAEYKKYKSNNNN